MKDIKSKLLIRNIKSKTKLYSCLAALAIWLDLGKLYFLLTIARGRAASPLLPFRPLRCEPWSGQSCPRSWCCSCEPVVKNRDVKLHFISLYLKLCRHVLYCNTFTINSCLNISSKKPKSWCKVALYFTLPQTLPPYTVVLSLLIVCTFRQKYHSIKFNFIPLYIDFIIS